MIDADPYKMLYYRLFNRITDVIQDLQDIQTEAEEMFLTQEKEPPAPDEEEDG